MTLKDLLEGIKVKTVTESTVLDREVGTIGFDSRKLGAGDIFVALEGATLDGHDYISSLKDRDLTAVIAERIPDGCGNLPIVLVDNTHKALGIVASNFYGRPSEKVMLIGVTGTNGKTTIATLIYEMARRSGLKSGLLSTIANYIDGEKIPATHTTPDPIAINALLKRMADSGCQVVAMEVSSHAAHQHRIAGLKFKGGIFTNLTRDHLDYHKTFQAYRDAKKMFFDGLDADAFALTNIDDPNGEFMLQNTAASRHTYSLRSHADFAARILAKFIDSTLITINGTELETMFSGVYNIYNLTAVYGALVLSGFDAAETLVNLSLMRPVAGRFQTIRSTNGLTVVIDYAHTPDALQNVLNAIKDVADKGSRVITVFGAGGNRDRGKRKEMGKIASINSDIVILTSDNPRDEDPESILADIQEGIDEGVGKLIMKNTDRREAIKMAIALANPGDIILIAGKGHEDYQEIKGQRHHFSDSEEVIKIFDKIK